MTFQPTITSETFTNRDMADHQIVCNSGNGDMIAYRIPGMVVAMLWYQGDKAGTIITRQNNEWASIGTWHGTDFTAQDAQAILGCEAMPSVHCYVDNGIMANPA